MHSKWKLSVVSLGALLLASPTLAVSINLGQGPLLDLSGVDASVDVDASLGGSHSSGGSGGLAADVDATLGAEGGGSSSASSPALVDADVLIDLFGKGASRGTKAKVDVGLGGTGASNLADADVTLDLFGSPSGGGAGNGPSGGQGGGQPGGGNGAGPSGGNGTGQGSGIGTGSGTVIRGGLVANLGNADCFAPNATQLATLTARHDYSAPALATWLPVRALKVVDVRMCASAGSRAAANVNVAQLQDFIRANAALRQQLAAQGHAPGEVIAADKQGATLIVYVM